MLNTSEWVGFAVTICLAGAFVSLALWAAGRSQGIPAKRLRGKIAVLWLAIVMAVGGLLLLRARLGGGVIDYSAQSEAPVTIRTLGAPQWTLVALGIIWTVVWMLVALKTVRGVTEGLARRRLP